MANSPQRVVRSLGDYEYEGASKRDLVRFALDVLRAEDVRTIAIYGDDFVARVGRITIRTKRGRQTGDKPRLYATTHQTIENARHEYQTDVAFYESGGF